MRRIIVIFLFLLASTWLGTQLQHDPGYFLITFHHWSIETTLSVAILGLFLIFILFHILLSAFHWIIHFPTMWENLIVKRRIRNARAKTKQGLIEFSEGHWLKAKNHLIKALPNTDAPLLNYLTAARAAQEMGDSKLRDDYLREAQQSMPEAKVAIELTQAQLQLANHQWEQALATLRHLQDLAPNHPYVLKLLMNLYEEVKDWPQLIALLPSLKQQKIVTGNTYELLQQRTFLEAMRDLIKQDEDQVLKEFIKALPKNLKNNPKLMAEYCQYLIIKKNTNEAEDILHRILTKQFDEDLIKIYGQINSNEKQLNFAESLLKTNPHSAALLLCLGILSKNQNLWGKAITYLEQSIELEKTKEAYLELGKLLELLSKPNEACEAYYQGLLLATKL